MSRSDKRTYLDPIHQDIVLSRSKPEEELIIRLIDTREFQRLRRVHQLGVTYFTYQGAEGSRFTHSVGVMHVANSLLDHLEEDNPSIKEYRALILASALLHDIGHGPFSHVTEKILGYHHEEWSCKIVCGDTEVRDVLDSYKETPGLADKVVSVLKKKHQPQWVSHTVSSQLDCDRFDYLLRDSYMTGTKYGLFALRRILRSLEIDHENDRIIVAGEKGQIAVEDYLFARYSMYAQVYYHRKNLAARGLLAKLIKRVKYLMSISDKPACFVDDSTAKWFAGEHLEVDDYLQLDDVELIYHIKRWVTDDDDILQDLAARFLHRRLFKAFRIPSANTDFLKYLESEAAKIAEKEGFDPSYYIGIESTGFRPYDYYSPDDENPQTNIIIRTDNGQTLELSKVSMAIEALVKGNYESYWLVYPNEISDKIEVIKELVPIQ